MTRTSVMASAAAIVGLLALPLLSVPLSTSASAYWTSDAAAGAGLGERSAGGGHRGSGARNAYYGRPEARRGASYARASYDPSPRPGRGGRRGHSYAGLSSPCAQARSMGGPCGCVASEHIFGSSVRELWLARNWLRFPRATPAAGTAAVWRGGHHVEAVVATNGDGSITTSGPYGTRRVSLGSVVIVDPHGAAVAQAAYPGRAGRRHYASVGRRWRHRHYAGA